MADDIGTLKCSFVQNKSAPLLFQTLNFGRPNGGPPLVMDLHFVPGLHLSGRQTMRGPAAFMIANKPDMKVFVTPCNWSGDHT